MPVSLELVKKTAELCRLSLVPPDAAPEAGQAALERMAEQLGAIVSYMDILNAVDTEGVEPLYAPARNVAPPRPDTAEKRLTAEDILANAPARQHSFFVVPPAI